MGSRTNSRTRARERSRPVRTGSVRMGRRGPAFPGTRRLVGLRGNGGRSGVDRARRTTSGRTRSTARHRRQPHSPTPKLTLDAGERVRKTQQPRCRAVCNLSSRARPDTRRVQTPAAPPPVRRSQHRRNALNILYECTRPHGDPSKCQNRFQARFSLHLGRPTARPGPPTRKMCPNGAKPVQTKQPSRTACVRTGFAPPERVLKIDIRAGVRDGVQDDIADPSP